MIKTINSASKKYRLLNKDVSNAEIAVALDVAISGDNDGLTENPLYNLVPGIFYRYYEKGHPPGTQYYPPTSGYYPVGLRLNEEILILFNQVPEIQIVAAVLAKEVEEQ